MPLMAQAVAEVPYIEIQERPWPNSLWKVLLISASAAVLVLLAIWFIVAAWRRRSADGDKKEKPIGVVTAASLTYQAVSAPFPSLDGVANQDDAARQEVDAAEVEDNKFCNGISSLTSSWNSFSLPVLPSPFNARRRSVTTNARRRSSLAVTGTHVALLGTQW